MDGNGWLCNGMLLLPATGQTAFELPFPTLDVFHSGYFYVSSPAPKGTLSATIEYADTQAPSAVGLLTYRLNGQLIAQFDYRGTANEPGYYPDGTLRFAREWLPGNRTAEWRWDYSPDGSLQSETSRLDEGNPKEVQFAYDVNGNLTRWGDDAPDWRYDYNRLWWVGGSHPHGGSYNWYMTYTPNGDRARLWNAPQPIEGDVNGDGVVDDADLLAVQFALGQQCPQGCPEDLNRDGQVDDGDLMIVLFNFGQSAGEVSWGYQYDVWGNLMVASSSQAGVVLNAIYDSLGRRVGLQGVRSGVPFEVWRLYEDDTLLAEVDSQGRVVAEYVWGPLGPMARLDYSGSGVSCYYVLDALGHVRVLLSSGGEALEVWRYDSWGVPLSPPENPIPQPFLWNGAYGYEWDCFGGTGLYHVGARAYDPRTARWLQRDPIDAASGDPNLYRYCGNDPINCADPTGLVVLRPPHLIQFTQESIGQRFRDGRSIWDLIEGLKSGRIQPQDVPPIRIFEWQGQLYTLDNRRLYAFQQAGKEVPTVWATPEEVQREAVHGNKRYRGSSTRVRGLGRALGVFGLLLLGADLARAAGAPCGQRSEAVGNVLGSYAGGLAGAWAGAKVGMALGSAFGPVGTVVGGAAGAIIGGIIGSTIGGEIGGRVGGYFDNPCECP